MLIILVINYEKKLKATILEDGFFVSLHKDKPVVGIFVTGKFHRNVVRHTTNSCEIFLLVGREEADRKHAATTGYDDRKNWQHCSLPQGATKRTGMISEIQLRVLELSGE